ncbi:GNAT family N-acetyltransferase [Paenibacillus sp. J5C_2022]|uniref:GNAT family N-acetyltransferase n=1 Tax=Paenibacillus sp. J5C2022 TaxID=2977129 RepID=UPI0021D3A94D|nr:GNAT family N-acetyltransferase [Paenibacillus sp. J5C2022]MCU6708684.1 GNAT family N-acetyltransferase [Paenibacillus sp. J5C2022]
MLKLKANDCLCDDDYARFARFYIAHSKEFHSLYSLHDALLYVMDTVTSSRLMLLDNEDGQLSAFIQYRYEDNGTVALIDSAILERTYRSSRIFFTGFRDIVRQIDLENESVCRVRFHALTDHAYLNRLYGKFARRIGEREGTNGRENVYETSMQELRRYLRL